MDDLRKTIRLRHETRRRQATVAERRFVTPGLLAISLACDDLSGFVSASPDDHVKLFVPDAPDGDGKPPMRDYTPRSFDIARGELTIEFALHDDPGPATAWAMAAAVGDGVSIGGPRGSAVISDRYDWYWLIGDETALPSIARRIDEWPEQSMVALVAITGREEEVSLGTRDGLSVEWVYRPAAEAGDPGALLARLAGWTMPPGDGFVWIAAESGVARAVRQWLIDRGHPVTQMKAAGYWTLGRSDMTEKFD